MNIKKMISGLVVMLLSGIVLAQNKPLITEKEAQLPPAKGELKTREILEDLVLKFCLLTPKRL